MVLFSIKKRQTKRESFSVSSSPQLCFIWGLHFPVGTSADVVYHFPADMNGE